MISIGIDIGATTIKGALTSDGRSVLARCSRPTRADESLEHSIAELHACIGELRGQSDESIGGIGVGVPGSIDSEQGIVHQPPNMPAWIRVPLADLLRERWQCEVRIDNDANCAALGEAFYGAAKEHRSFVGLTLGTGVGSGIIIDNRIYHGMHGFAGEFGHLTIDMNGPLCNCGNRGCIEAYIGIHHLMREALPILQADSNSVLHRKAIDSADGLSPKDIGDAAAQGDPACIDILRTAGERLGVAIASAANLLDITVFIIGGGIAAAGAPLFEGIRTTAGEHVLAVHRLAMTILPAQLGNDAGMLGASALLTIYD